MLMSEYFFWPRLARYVEFLIKMCLVCQKAKGRLLPQGLFMPLLIPKAPWEDISLDFITGLPRTQHQKDSIIHVLNLSRSNKFE